MYHKDDVKALLSLRGKVGLYITVAIYTGLRVAEILPMKWNTVIDEKGNPRKEFVFMTGRRVKKPRRITYSPEFRRKIKSFFEQDFKDHHTNMYMFPPGPAGSRSNKRRYMSSQAMRALVKRHTATLELHTDEEIKLYTLRKTFAYYHSQANGIEMTSETLGHANVQTTRTYIGLTRRAVAESYKAVSFVSQDGESLVDRMYYGDFDVTNYVTFLKKRVDPDDWYFVAKDYCMAFTESPDEAAKAANYIVSKATVGDDN